MKDLLPVGSVVLLKDGEKRLMICGRIQTDIETGSDYDYCACYYPEGMISSKELFMFNNDDIKRVYFIGFQDSEEFQFRKFLAENTKKENKN